MGAPVLGEPSHVTTIAHASHTGGGHGGAKQLINRRFEAECGRFCRANCLYVLAPFNLRPSIRGQVRVVSEKREIYGQRNSGKFGEMVFEGRNGQ